jgi:hypothetical protein
LQWRKWSKSYKVVEFVHGNHTLKFIILLSMSLPFVHYVDGPADHFGTWPWKTGSGLGIFKFYFKLRVETLDLYFILILLM